MTIQGVYTKLIFIYKMASQNKYLKGIQKRRARGIKERKTTAMKYPSDLMRVAKDIWGAL